MRKFLIILTAFAAALFCLSSCNMDKDDNFLIGFEVLAVIHDDDTRAALEEYLDGELMQETNTLSYYGKYYDAYVKARDFFATNREKLDGYFILDCIQEEDEFVQISCVLNGTNRREYVDYAFWDYNLKKELEPVSE